MGNPLATWRCRLAFVIYSYLLTGRAVGQKIRIFGPPPSRAWLRSWLRSWLDVRLASTVEVQHK